jgi:hypothetical protein
MNHKWCIPLGSSGTSPLFWREGTETLRDLSKQLRAGESIKQNVSRLDQLDRSITEVNAIGTVLPTMEKVIPDSLQSLDETTRPKTRSLWPGLPPSVA